MKESRRNEIEYAILLQKRKRSSTVLYWKIKVRMLKEKVVDQGVIEK